MAILKGIISKLNGSAGNLTFKQLGGPEAEACSNCASRVSKESGEEGKKKKGCHLDIPIFT